MTEHEASRTLVKSAPELWAECSDPSSLARHLDQFGEIRITRLEPETAVAWEGELASGTVKLEPSGWGTKVTLTALTVVAAGDEPVAEVAVQVAEPVVEVAEPVVEVAEPVVEVAEPVVEAPKPAVETAEPAPVLERPRFMARLRAWLGGGATVAQPMVAPGPTPLAEPVPEPEPIAEQEPTTEPAAVAAPESPLEPDPGQLLTAALDSLGQAHHRPFSRA